MVRIIVFVPSLDMLEPIRALAAEWESGEIRIDAVHRYGTPESLGQLEPYDVIVARGITYTKIRKLYPDKHITQLLFDGFDIIEALFQCRNLYHPGHIGVCLNWGRLPDLLPELEELCGAKISLYDVQDEQSALKAVEDSLRDGAQALLGGGTVSNICKERGIPCVYVHMRLETIRQAMVEARKVACSINLERTKSHIIRTILNSSEDAVLALDETGKVLEANDQAYRLYGLAFLTEWRGAPVEQICPDLRYIGSSTLPCRDGDEELLNLNGQRYMVKYRLISGETSAIGTLITTSSADRIMQEEQQLRKGLVRRGLTAKYTFRDMIAVSQGMCSQVEIAKKFSRVHSNVLLTGETGTGKELFAHSIHAASARAGQPFVAVNCATLPENLLESELFGYEAGAFSGASREGKAGLFEQAHRGTIFLDEIGEIPVTLQAKLLRVLQEKEVRRVGSNSVLPIDVRVIAATNVDIQQQIRQGRFRSDLFYRLNTLEIRIPPLRERREDILPLIEHQLRVIAAGQGSVPPKLTPDAQALLVQYRWPGNVRELRNVCERIVVMSTSSAVDGDAIQALHIFQEPPSESVTAHEPPDAGTATLTLPPVVRKKDLARELGVSRTTLWRMTKRQEQEKQAKKTGEN